MMGVRDATLKKKGAGQVAGAVTIIAVCGSLPRAPGPCEHLHN